MENSLVVARGWRVEEAEIRWGCKEDKRDPGGEYIPMIEMTKVTQNPSLLFLTTVCK